MAPDGTGFSSDNADKYYAKIRNNERKHYAKSHIAIDVDSRLILYSQAVRGAKHDTTFVIASIRSLKKHDPEYVTADKAYDTEKIRECINKEIKASDQIPLKSNFRH
ncbi:MAG: transposase [Methanobrevibacter smithii]|mgnify:FL=1|nr:transposase [Methanobrevibacter smithii]MDO5830011.1 transposase [Methanobrevibacter smithii]